jgi:MerR family transcriptional regulator, light-induced transcriptional regulator
LTGHGLSIGEVVRATGVGEATLRAWERRYGFPVPRREPSGHRRYDADDVQRIARVAAERDRGIALPLAIERARGTHRGAPSLYARLRARRPDLQPFAVRKRQLVALSRAVEDESLARAERPVLVGSFQRERFYRQSEHRWRELARGAATSFVLADFRRLARPDGGPIEVPVDASHPLAREWGIVCDAPEHGVCLVAWEPPGRASSDAARLFEVLLSVEPGVVREAAEAAVEIAAPAVPELAAAVRERFAQPPLAATIDQLRLSAAITTRLVHELSSHAR